MQSKTENIKNKRKICRNRYLILEYSKCVEALEKMWLWLFSHVSFLAYLCYISNSNIFRRNFIYDLIFFPFKRIINDSK